MKTGHETKQVISNRVLPQSVDWINYGKEENENSNKIQENINEKAQEIHAHNKPVDLRREPKKQTVIRVRRRRK